MSGLQQSLSGYGLFASVPVTLSAETIDEFGFAETEKSLLLIGNRGSSYWPHFSHSKEFADGQADPLDRWSKRIARALCQQHAGYRPLFPSDGPPWLPFQRWAMATRCLFRSPLGLLIHPDYGLWHSFRFALLFDPDGISDTTADRPDCSSPCDSCAGKPCLDTCPVNAFGKAGYDFMSCVDFLKANPRSTDCGT